MSVPGSRFERHWRRGLVEHFDDGRQIEYPLGDFFQGIVSDAPSRLKFLDTEGWGNIRALIWIFVMVAGFIAMMSLGGIYRYIIGTFLVTMMVLLSVLHVVIRILFIEHDMRTTVTPWRRQRLGQLVLPRYHWITIVLGWCGCLLFVAIVCSLFWSSPGERFWSPGEREASMIEGVIFSGMFLGATVYVSLINWSSHRAAKVVAEQGRTAQK